MGKYEPFENMVFVDTLDNLGFGEKRIRAECGESGRIKKQNDRRIPVIIRNPPYNAK